MCNALKTAPFFARCYPASIDYSPEESVASPTPPSALSLETVDQDSRMINMDEMITAD